MTELERVDYLKKLQIAAVWTLLGLSMIFAPLAVPTVLLFQAAKKLRVRWGL